MEYCKLEKRGVAIMRYKCSKDECGKVFIHPAKQIEHQTDEKTMQLIVDKIIRQDTLPQEVNFSDWKENETTVCPFCQSLEYTEFVEPQETVSSIKKVLHEEADAYIAQGYQPKEYYAKEVVMIKTAPQDQKNAYITFVVNPKIPEGKYQITTNINGKEVVFNNCELVKSQEKLGVS
jgi:hypothetical protein